MRKTGCIDYVCRPYCRFFREGEKEEMTCMGARIAANLARTSCFDTETAIAAKKEASVRPVRRHDGALFENVCRPCEFRAEDCEYRMEDPPWDAVPCGGLLLLALLMEKGVLGVADLKGGLPQEMAI